MFKNIICFPHKLGQRKFGVEKAPDIVVNYLKKKSMFMKIIRIAVQSQKKILAANPMGANKKSYVVLCLIIRNNFMIKIQIIIEKAFIAMIMIMIMIIW